VGWTVYGKAAQDNPSLGRVDKPTKFSRKGRVNTYSIIYIYSTSRMQEPPNKIERRSK